MSAIFIPRYRQPQTPLRPSNGGRFTPSGLWIPAYGGALWTPTGWLQPSVNTNTIDAHGSSVSRVGNGSSTFLNWIVSATNAYPLIVGGVFQVREISTANQTAVGMGGATLSTGIYGGVGQYTATTAGGWMRGSLGSSDVSVNGATVAVGSLVSAVFVSRSATDNTLWVNGIKYTNSATNGGLNDSWLNFSISASDRATTAIFYGKQSVALGFYGTNGVDPGDAWMREFSLRPWAAFFAPQRASIFAPGVSAGATTHTTTGDLVADAATVAGATVHPHTTTGALVSDAAVVAGTAAHLTLHTSTGALVADAAVVAGSATLAPAPVTHTTTGALVADAARVSGSAALPQATNAGGWELRPYSPRVGPSEDDTQAQREAMGIVPKRPKITLKPKKPEKAPPPTEAPADLTGKDLALWIELLKDDISKGMGSLPAPELEVMRLAAAAATRRQEEEDMIFVLGTVLAAMD